MEEPRKFIEEPLINKDKTQNVSIEKEQNPIENANFISKLLFVWLTPLVMKSRKGTFEQEAHWDLYNYLKVNTRLAEFQKYIAKTKNVVALLYKMFSFKCRVVMITIFYNTFDIMDIMLMYYLTQLLNYYDLNPEVPYDFVKLGLYFGFFIIIEIGKAVMMGIFDHTIFNEMIISKNCLTFSILQKSFQMQIGSASKSSKGNIINLIQVDCNTIKDNGGDITFLLYSTIIGVISFTLCFYFMGIAFFIFLGISFTFMFLSFVIYKVKLKYEQQLLKLKDVRISMMKNVLKNLKFIKFHVFENLFAKLVYDQREKEIRKLRVIFSFFILVVFINWLNPNLSFLLTISFVFFRKATVSIATMITFYKLFEYVNMFFRIVPYFFELYFKFKLVNIRMKTFFDLPNTDDSHIALQANTQSKYIDENSYVDEEEIKDRMDMDSEYAIEIKDGSFTYSDLGLDKLKQVGREPEKKKEKESSDNQDNETKDEESIPTENDKSENEQNETKTETETETEKNKSKFELKNINLKIKSGELTFIIGKIGSGKTSLLYSMLGEINPSNENTKIIFGSESIAYCPQSPFIQTKSVKENIAFYEPLDDERLKNSVRMAALESDLKLFDKGLDSMLGEGGTNISGGQRTRINLARCFYKPKDIYLLDDPLSSLDFHVACEIIENAIQKDLKNKTRVIVTHSIQYLMYADKIIYLDEGEIKFDGNYDNFQSTELYSELKKTIENEENKDEEENTRKKSMTEYESHVSMGTTEQLSKRKGSFEVCENLEGGRKRSSSHERQLISETDRINNNLNNFNNQMITNDIFKKKSDIEDENNEELQNLQESWKKADKGPSSIQEDSEELEPIRIRHDTIRTHKDQEDDQLGSEKTIETITESITKDELNKKALQNIVKDVKKAKKIEKYFLKEDKAEGRRLIMTAKLFLNYTGGFTLYLIILAICIINAFMDYFCLNYLYDFILNFEEEKKHLGSSLVYLYSIFLGPVILVVIRTSVITICSVKTSRNIHHKMTIKTIYGDLLGFHDRVETARLINRFSTDTDEMDKSIPYRVSVFMLYTGFLISDVIVGIITIGWWVLIAYAIYYIIMFYYQNLYVKFKKDLYRLESVTRSPIVNVTNEILEGKMILKVFKKEKAIMKELVNYLEENSKNLTIQNALTNWFSIRVSLFNVIVVQMICFIFIYCALYFDFITIKKVILFMPFVLNFIWNIDFWINIFSQLETSLISLERCQAFEDIPNEKNYLNVKEIFRRMTGSRLANKTHLDFVKTFKPLSYVEELIPQEKKNIDLRDDDEYDQINKLDNNSCIFDKGRISFNKVDAKYPTKEALTLMNFSFEVKAGEKIGIVGQTGSGKSTIIKLLSQYLSHCNGDIIIDGYDIKKLDLQILRHQYLLLSQEVALFDGTIKENIDIEEIVNRTKLVKKKSKKQDQYKTLNSSSSLNMSKLQISDDEIVKNMISFGFSKEKLEKDGLNFKIENNGGNLSQGEQQLVALMKALYTQKNIIILDEATSNIDYQSEKKIMDFFYDKIVNKTLITVAHRINTVLRCDRIIVLDEGKIVETGKTKSLLKDESSRFYQLYKKLTENMEQE